MQREEGKASGKFSEVVRRGSLKQRRIEEVLEEKVRRERELPSCSSAGAVGGKKNSETQQGGSKRKQRESPGEENSKKKVDTEKEQSAFNRSNLTARSPEKEEMKGEEKGRLERIEDMLGKLMLGMEESKKTMHERFNKVEERMETWENRWEGLESRVGEVKEQTMKEFGKVREEMEGLEAKVGEVKEQTKKEIEKVREEMEEKWKVWGEEAEGWRARTLAESRANGEGNERADRGEGAEEGETGRRERQTEERDRREINYVRELMEAKEKEKKKNNIVITGLKEIGERGKEAIKDWFRERLELEIEVERTWMIGTRKEKVCVQLKTEEKKEEIMREKRKLEGTRIFIDHDFTWKERKMREMLRNAARQKRAEGLTVKIGYSKLWIEGVEHRWDEERGTLFRRE